MSKTWGGQMSSYTFSHLLVDDERLFHVLRRDQHRHLPQQDINSSVRRAECNEDTITTMKKRDNYRQLECRKGTRQVLFPIGWPGIRLRAIILGRLKRSRSTNFYFAENATRLGAKVG
jgi:hypothetical protein